VKRRTRPVARCCVRLTKAAVQLQHGNLGCSSIGTVLRKHARCHLFDLRVTMKLVTQHKRADQACRVARSRSLAALRSVAGAGLWPPQRRQWCCGRTAPRLQAGRGGCCMQLSSPIKHPTNEALSVVTGRAKELTLSVPCSHCHNKVC
jgi:hypothetical protein